MLITYYWPPSGGSGVQRWLKFVKYLPEFGWRPYVLTPESPSFTIRDESLLADVPPAAVVCKLPIWEPYNLFFALSRFIGKKPMGTGDFVSTGKLTPFQRLTTWIRGNLFIPDARVFWVRPATRFLRKYLRENGIKTIVTTGPPHSIHLIGLRLKKSDPSIHWVADFRDPWSEWDLLDTLSLSKRSRVKHIKLELEVLQEADRVITIAPYHVKRLEALGGRAVDLITNGFDPVDFSTIKKSRTERFTIAHVGMVDELRDPRPVMESILNLCRQSPDFSAHLSVIFIGTVNSAFRAYIESNDVLRACTSFIAHVPHQELLKSYGSTDLQLLVLAHTAIAPGNLPGKFFEYLASGNRILAVGPSDGDAAQILRDSQAGEIFERNDESGIRGYLSRAFEEWKSGTLNKQGNIAKFTRRTLTSQLIRLLDYHENKTDKKDKRSSP